MEIESLASGVQALLLATPQIENLVSLFPGEQGDVPALFRSRAPQEAVTPYLVWQHIVTPIEYSSCGEVESYDSTIQLDLVGSDQEEVDRLYTALSEHLSFNSGPFADINVGAVFLGPSTDESWDDIETDGDIESPISRLDLKIHWNPTT